MYGWSIEHTWFHANTSHLANNNFLTVLMICVQSIKKKTVPGVVLLLQTVEGATSLWSWVSALIKTPLWQQRFVNCYCIWPPTLSQEAWLVNRLFQAKFLFSNTTPEAFIQFGEKTITGMSLYLLIYSELFLTSDLPQDDLRNALIQLHCDICSCLRFLCFFFK